MAKKGKKGGNDGAKNASEPRDTLSSAPSQASITAEESPVAAPTDSTAPRDLQEALSQIASLKAQLALKDQEIEALRAASSKPASTERPEHLVELQEKLRRLRKEQMDADAAKDAAWRQLKAVVVEISKLAAPPS